jgi:hypothetical protein
MHRKGEYHKVLLLKPVRQGCIHAAFSDSEQRENPFGSYERFGMAERFRFLRKSPKVFLNEN